MGLSLLVVTQLFLKVSASDARRIARKQKLTSNNRSRSFKVMHFGINKKPWRDRVSLYNNAGLISNVSEELARENAENCRC